MSFIQHRRQPVVLRCYKNERIAHQQPANNIPVMQRKTHNNKIEIARLQSFHQLLRHIFGEKNFDLRILLQKLWQVGRYQVRQDGCQRA